jgi:adenine deaminase
MYVLLREGSACHDLRSLAKAVTLYNSRRCLLCSDDRQPKSILEHGHMEHHLRICVEEGISPIVAIQMTTLNVAECYHLYDRGAIAPGLRGDIVLFEDLESFKVDQVYVMGEEVARSGNYLLETLKYPIDSVFGRFQVKDFSIDKLCMKLTSNYVNIIDILPGGILTEKNIAEVKRDDQGEFVYDQSLDIAKIAVIERHQNTGNVGLALIRGYGIQSGAIAVSIAHDSHNIITVGTNDEDMAFAVEQLIAQNGGIILVRNGKILNSMPMVVGGIMSDQTGEWVNEKLMQLHRDSQDKLGITTEVDPIMTLCFMSLAVIPEIKLTDMGLFDVARYSFINLQADE